MASAVRSLPQLRKAIARAASKSIERAQFEDWNVVMCFPASKPIEFDGRTQSINAWAREVGVHSKTIAYRLARWLIADALITPAWAQRKRVDQRMVRAIEAVDVNSISPKKGSHHFIEFQGKQLSLTEWARVIGLSHATLSARLRLGWSIERALTTPKKKRTPKPSGGGLKLSNGGLRPAGVPRAVKNRIGS